MATDTTKSPPAARSPGFKFLLIVILTVAMNAEDYALLICSGLLFAALAATMYVTRRINRCALTATSAG